MPDIRLFTKPGCPYCVDAKEWLDAAELETGMRAQSGKKSR